VNADPWFLAHPNEDRFGVTTLPYNATICGANNANSCRSAVLGGAVLGIPTSSTHKVEAKMFLQEIASKEFQLEMAINGTGNTPMLKEIYTDGSLNGTSQEFKNQLAIDVYPNVLPRPVHPKYTEMSKAIQPLYHNGFSGASSISESLEAMDEQVNLILGLVDTSPTTVIELSTVTGAGTTETISTPGLELLATIMSLAVIGIVLRKQKR
jgi:ABC-type glycerol-3-phosphate transport system substrate-binding protein